MTETRTEYHAGQPAVTEGWGRPVAAIKFHYFIDNKSLCEKWQWTGGELGPLDEKSIDDCCARCCYELIAHKSAALTLAAGAGGMEER